MSETGDMATNNDTTEKPIENAMSIEDTLDDESGDKTEKEKKESPNEENDNNSESAPLEMDSDKLEDSSKISASYNDEDSIENDIYNINNSTVPPNYMDSLDGFDNNTNDKAVKRAGDVITIDSDSDDSSVCHVESYQATPSEAKRLRMGYSTSPSSSSSPGTDESDEESVAGEVIVDGPSLLSKCARNLEYKSLDLIEFVMNSCFTSEKLIENFTLHWSKEEPFEAENLILHNDPFQICVLNDFLMDSEAIHNIVDDINTLDWTKGAMDLYEFYRTGDLKALTWQRSIKSMYDLLKNNVMSWVAKVTDTELTHISASCALYGPGDHLLVHDDLMDDRKIAFIFYLAPWNIIDQSEAAEQSDDRTKEMGWKKSMGGQLEFFATNDSKQPINVVKSLVPRNNTFAFFKVGNNSFHQVTEVTSYDFPRLTINGWFHGPIEISDDSKIEQVKPTDVILTAPNTIVLQKDLVDWVTEIYLSPMCRSQIVQKFEDTSEISLVNFFSQNKYEEILNILRSDDLPWEICGPINLRHYEMLPLDKLAENESYKVLKDFSDLLGCKHFVDLLEGYTGLSITSYCKLEIQKWSAGKYTVIPLKDEFMASEIDIVIYLGCPDKPVKGGSITYLLPEEQGSDAIISVELKNNALNIVFCEPGLARFTKYLSKLSLKSDESFYMIVCSYRNNSTNS